jgi:TRAP-type mannitol/chloroaromatic compound transport system permease small subunit
MASALRSRFYRGLTVFLLAVATVLLAGYGVLLLIEVFKGRGSAGGNALLFVLGLILFVLPLVAFTVVIAFWMLSRPSRDNGS